MFNPQCWKSWKIQHVKQIKVHLLTAFSAHVDRSCLLLARAQTAAPLPGPRPMGQLHIMQRFTDLMTQMKMMKMIVMKIIRTMKEDLFYMPASILLHVTCSLSRNMAVSTCLTGSHEMDFSDSAAVKPTAVFVPVKWQVINNLYWSWCEPQNVVCTHKSCPCSGSGKRQTVLQQMSLFWEIVIYTLNICFN